MRKIIFILLTVALLASCNVYKHPYSTTVVAIDFSEYTRMGFFITESNSVSFNYEPISSVIASVETGYEVLGSENHTSDDLVYGSYTRTKYGKYVRATPQQAIEELYQAAVDMGADGVINFKITYTPFSSYDGKIISFESYLVSGMTIKRK